MLSTVTNRSFARILKKATLVQQPFEFKNRQQVEAIFAKYPADQKRSAVIPLLHLGQEENGGFISSGVIDAVSKETGTPKGRVHETATFYSMFRFTKPNKHVLEICRGLSCFLNGSDNLKKEIEKATRSSFADSTKGSESKNNDWTLLEVECLGACANAPVMIIDGVYYQDLNKHKILKIISSINKGKPVKDLDAIHTKPARPLL